MATVALSTAAYEAVEVASHGQKLLDAWDDVNAFAEFCLRDKDGKPWKQQDFHRAWQAKVPDVGPARVLIGAPREHAKSTQMSVARVLFELGHNPNLRVKIVASGDDLATALVQEVAQNIERNSRVQEVFPDLVPDTHAGWTRTKLFVKRTMIAKDPSVEAAGITSTGAGGRADLIIFDDVVDFRNAIGAPALREQTKRAFKEVWTNLLGPDGRAVYVATVWHADDLTCELRGNAEWDCWWQPALNEETGAVLWPEKWSREALNARKREIGPRAFARQFQLVPISDDERTFSDAAIMACMRQGIGMPVGEWSVPLGWEIVIGVDLATSMARKASHNVAFVVAVEPTTRKRVPVAIHRDSPQSRWKFPDIVNLIGDLWETYKPSQIRVENNGFQEVLVQQLNEVRPGAPVVGHTTGRNKADETIGLPGLSATMANGSWVIPAGIADHNADCTCNWCAWVDELRGHPTAAHSDIVMAMWFADAAVTTARKRGSHGAYFAEDILPAKVG